MLTKGTLKTILTNCIEDIDNGNSNFTQSEMEEVIDTLNRVTQPKLSKYQACNLLHVSRATFDNWVREGRIPEGRKEAGFKEKFWYKSDILNELER